MLLLALFVALVSARAQISSAPVSFPGAPPGSASAYSGYVLVNETAGANLFYTLFESQNNAKTDPLVLWLTGGPGCSSELAMLFENGPYNVVNGSLVNNPWSWNTNASVLYVDSPVGTGFSYVQASDGFATSEKQIADDLFLMLQAVIGHFPYLSANNGSSSIPFFIAGESYAGHYVFAISERIVTANKKRAAGDIVINLQGTSCGNGMTFPRKQYAVYSDFSLQHGLIGRAEKKAVDEQYALCEQALDGGDPRGANASQVCNQVMNMVLEAAGNINVYDMQKSCDTALCYPGIADVKTYLDQPAVLKALNVAPWFTQWTSCNNSVYGHIATPDWYNQEEYTVPVLLDSIRILIYAGLNDFVCNAMSNYAWVSDMDWNLKGEWNAAPHKVWSSADGKTVKGYVQAYGPLSFVSVTAAGHMVPHDQPQNAWEMFYAFLNDTPLPSPPANKRLRRK